MFNKYASHFTRAISLGAWCGALMLPTDAQGQTVEELEQRLSMLRERLELATVAADLADSLYAARIPTVSIVAGPVRALATPSQEEFARSVVNEAWGTFSGMVGSDVEPTQTLVFLVYDQPEGPIVFTDANWLEVFVDSIDTRGAVVSIARARIGGELTANLPEILRSWIGSIPLPVDRNRSWSSIYDRLVITQSRASRSCYEGSLEWCWEAFGISDIEPSWDRWYAASDLAAMVGGRYPRGSRAWTMRTELQEQQFRDCQSGTSSAQCVRFLEAAGDRSPDIPLGYEVREDLLQYALETGGPGSYKRAVGYTGSDLKELLSLISGTDADELMASWRTRLMSEYAPPDERVGLGFLTTLTWVALLGLVAGRSARWN